MVLVLVLVLVPGREGLQSPVAARVSASPLSNAGPPPEVPRCPSRISLRGFDDRAQELWWPLSLRFAQCQFSGQFVSKSKRQDTGLQWPVASGRAGSQAACHLQSNLQARNQGKLDDHHHHIRRWCITYHTPAAAAVAAADSGRVCYRRLSRGVSVRTWPSGPRDRRYLPRLSLPGTREVDRSMLRRVQTTLRTTHWPWTPWTPLETNVCPHTAPVSPSQAHE